MTRDEIKSALDDMGVEYDGRRSTEDLQELLEQHTGPDTAPAQGDMIACVVLRDYWPDEDVRVRKHTVVHVEPMAAIEGIEGGKLARLK